MSGEAAWTLADAFERVPMSAGTQVMRIASAWMESAIYDCPHVGNRPTLWLAVVGSRRAMCAQCATSSAVLDTLGELLAVCHECGSAHPDVSVVSIAPIPPAELLLLIGLCESCRGRDDE